MASTARPFRFAGFQVDSISFDGADVDVLIRIARASDLKRLRYGDIEIEFWAPAKAAPAPGAAEQTARVLSKSESEPMCACGHPAITAHTASGCVHGCPIETCAKGLEEEDSAQ